MKRNLHTAFAAALLTALCLASCDDTDPVSYMPLYEGIAISPDFLRAGDSVTVTAVQQDKGRLIYHADYRWEVAYATIGSNGRPDTIRTSKHLSVVYDVESEDPVLKFLIPAGSGGRLQVRFRADFRYSAMGDTGHDGSAYDSRDIPGNIWPRQSTPTDGRSEGVTRWLPVAPTE